VRGVRLSINGSPTDPVAGLEQIVGQALLPVGTKKMVHLYRVALKLETVRQQAERRWKETGVVHHVKSKGVY